MKQSISLPQIPKNLQTDNKELYDYLFGLQQALLAKQRDDYGAVDKTSTDLTTLSGSVTTLSGSVTSFIANNKASQAQAIAGTLDTKIITPKSLRQGFNASGSAPVYACRAWVKFTGTGTVTIDGSGNVGSITDNGTGQYTINFTTEMQDTNYAVTEGSSKTSAAYATVCRILSTTKSAFSVNYGQVNNYEDPVDQSMVFFAIFR
jgi:hypothetical protein